VVPLRSWRRRNAPVRPDAQARGRPSRLPRAVPVAPIVLPYSVRSLS
jgi:hypothetical protein